VLSLLEFSSNTNLKQAVIIAISNLGKQKAFEAFLIFRVKCIE